jgi:hypothetical protein
MPETKKPANRLTDKPANRDSALPNLYVEQQALVQKIISHWTCGSGAVYNPARRSALELIKVKGTIADVLEDIKGIEDDCPKTAVTCARQNAMSTGYPEFREILKSGKPHLIVFGTAWGLAESFIAGADYILEPIMGPTDYNHLSVRTAAGIILDRLLGKRQLEMNLDYSRI